MGKEEIIEYTNGEITIVWKPGVCIHSGICARALPKVYKPQEKPWITIENASTEELIAQLKTCPSGALSYYRNGEKDKYLKAQEEKANKGRGKKGRPAAKSPKMVDLESGKTYAWCSCGKSSNQPWCDASHPGSGFNPKIFMAAESRTTAMCMCKQTSTPPFCDGTHVILDDD